MGVSRAFDAKAGVQWSVGWPVRVDTVILIAVVVSREQTKTRVGVDAAAIFVIAEVYFSRTSRERPGSSGGINGARGSWKNEWQQLCRNRIEAGRRQRSVR